MSFKLKPEIKEEWIAALESGDYLQTQQNLMDDRGYCCLGVLCKIVADKKGKKVYDYQDEDGQELPDFTLINSVAQTRLEPLDHLPEDVWGVEASNFVGNTYESTLYKLNDSGLNFDDIAKIIEEQF
jgi:hypothetical protein